MAREGDLLRVWVATISGKGSSEVRRQWCSCVAQSTDQSAICLMCIAWRSDSALTTAIREANMSRERFRQVFMHQSASEESNTESRRLRGESTAGCHSMSPNVHNFVLNLHIAIWELGLHVRIPNIGPSTPMKANTCTQLSPKRLHGFNDIHPLNARIQNAALRTSIFYAQAHLGVAQATPVTTKPQTS